MFQLHVSFEKIGSRDGMLRWDAGRSSSWRAYFGANPRGHIAADFTSQRVSEMGFASPPILAVNHHEENRDGLLGYVFAVKSGIGT